jgi:hypothetical protein
MRWARQVARKREVEKYTQGFGGEVRKKESLERPRRRWEDGIRMDLREIGRMDAD